MVPFQNPSIELFGVRVDEPVTSGTDIIVALIGIFAYFKTKGNSLRHVNYYRYFFLFIALSTFCAAFIGHAFNYRFGGIAAKVPGWILGIIGIGFSQFAVLYHTRSWLTSSAFKGLAILNSIEILLVTILIFIIPTFVIVEIHSAFGLVIMVCVLEGINYSKTKSILSRNMLIGVGLAVLAVASHIAKLAPSVWFNHLDVSHVFMMIGLYVMYKGVRHEQIKSQKK
jgi:uncharacterized membrane protein